VQDSSEKPGEIAFSQDALLGGRLIIRQPLHGYRVAIDPLLLAASVEASPGETILEVGSGVGTVSLCLATRLSYCRIIGIEIQKDLVRLANANIMLNQLRDRVEILQGDLQSPPPRLAAGSYSQVISNPPFFESNQGRLSPTLTKSLSNHENDFGMEAWLKFCLLMLKPLGRITFIYRADMLDKLLSLFYGKVGDVKVFPLWPTENKVAKRVIVQGIKGAKGGLSLLPGMKLHNEDGTFTQTANAILHNGLALSLAAEQVS
jgi:tRNA1(Val) A37 N6-methylase TrmN6